MTFFRTSSRREVSRVLGLCHSTFFAGSILLNGFLYILHCGLDPVQTKTESISSTQGFNNSYTPDQGTTNHDQLASSHLDPIDQLPDSYDPDTGRRFEQISVLIEKLYAVPQEQKKPISDEGVGSPVRI